MHVVLDFNPVLRHPFSGFWTYGQGLLGSLLKSDDIDRVTLLCNAGVARGAKESGFSEHPKVRFAAVRAKFRHLEAWWRWMPVPRLQALCGPFDVYHCIHHLMPPAGNAPRVMMVHDLRYYRLRDLYSHSRNAYFERAVAQADRFMTCSEYTKQDLIEYFHVEANRIDVTPLAMGEVFAPADETQKAAARSWLSQQAGRTIGSYALIMSSPDQRKNLPAAIRAFASVQPKLPKDFYLVISGIKPKGVDLDGIIREAGVSDHVVVTGALEHPQFRAVLAAADILLFMSLYEGFGLPLVEAMASGVPVLSSNRSCMPEVLGDAGVLVDPDDIPLVANELHRLASDSQFRQRLIGIGLQRVQQFNWDITAQKTIASYRKAVEEKQK